jgi:two-component system, chemotaxis family, protein-glutamate methylesterase/glutaminase
METTLVTERAGEGRVVGIGASAGGLAAVREVLHGLPSALPASLVVVLHLMPDHQSYLAQILSRTSPLPVAQAEDGQLLEPANVYVAPPDNHLVVGLDGRLTLEQSPPVRFVRPSIDRFLGSLADSYDGRAVAVILSGAGSDGAEGIRRVKAAGGTVLAQAAESAEHNGMPGAAAATGAVDSILPLGQIAAAIVAAVTVMEPA